jgi:hypothetical protein
VNRNTIALERPQSISKPNIQSYNGILKSFSVKEQAMQLLLPGLI